MVNTLLAKKVLEIIRQLIAAENYLLHTIIKCNNIFDTNILSTGYPTKFKFTEIPGTGGAMTRTPYSA